MRLSAGSLSSPNTSLILLTCCSVVPTDSRILQAYSDLVANLLIEVHILPNVESTANPTSTSADSTSVSMPCSCDFTLMVCDINCCCDPECTTADTTLFGDCLPGSSVTAQQFDKSCSMNSANEDKWHDVMCVIKDSNPSKGLVYDSVDVANDGSKYDNLRLNMAGIVSYSTLVVSNSFLRETGQSVYRSGDPVVTTITHLSGLTTVGQLSLPFTTLTEQCSEVGPIGYLTNSQTACSRLVSAVSCTSVSPLSILFYLIPETFVTRECPSSHTVRASPQSDVKAVYRYEYYCGSAPETVSLAGLAWNFSQDLTDQTGVSGFAEKMLCGVSSMDNLQSVPLETSFNDDTEVCENVVQRLQYILYWNSGNVVAIRALYLLANISLSEEESSTFISSGDINNETNRQVKLSQNFEVKFVYVPKEFLSNSLLNLSLPELDAALNSSGVLSGNPGYSIATSGSLVSGIFDYNSNRVNVSIKNQLRVWQSLSDSSCSQVRRQSIGFGHDLFSGCLLTLSLEDLRDRCDEVRQKVNEEQETLVAATHVGRYATSDPQVETEWVQIIL